MKFNKKYNYFDDDEVEQKSSFLSDIKNSDVPFMKKVKVLIEKAEEDIKVSIYTPSELKEFPLLKKRMYTIYGLVIIGIIVIISIIAFAVSINSANNKNQQFCADAGKVCSDYIASYGASRSETLDEKYGEKLSRLTGLTYARRMDFNNDKSDELMISYLDSGIYYLDVWGYDGKDFIKFYSDEASYSKSDVTLGSWITFYNHNNKYYICKSNSSSVKDVTLYSLSGTEFKKKKTCEYNENTKTYTINGEDNKADFEQIQMSFIRTSRAQTILDIVSDNMDEFDAKTVAQIEKQKTDEQLKNEAFYEIVQKYNTKYGKAQYVKDTSDGSYVNGLAVVDFVDFNGDGEDELFIAYRKELKKRKENTYSGEYIAISVPVYCMEVYSWNGTVAKCVFTKEGISTMFDSDKDDSQFYIFKKDGKYTEICSNTYVYDSKSVYTASSRIYKYTKENITTTTEKSNYYNSYKKTTTTKKDTQNTLEFKSIYDVRLEYEYGYRQYYIDNKSVYRTTFSSKGYDVPYFCSDDAYNTNEFTLYYLSGSNVENDDLVSRVSKTVKNIKELNSDYQTD